MAAVVTAQSTFSGSRISPFTIADVVIAAGNLLVVSIGFESGRIASTVTWNGISMTELGRIELAGNGESSIWYIEGQDGTGDVVATPSSTANGVVGAVVYSSASTPDGFASTSGNFDGEGGTSALDIATGVAGDFLQDATRVKNGTVAVGADQTVVVNESLAGNRGGVSYQDAAVSTIMDWTWFGTADVAYCACRVPDATGPAVPVISVPTATPLTATTASGTVDSDTADGTIYASVTQSATPPSAQDIKDGTGADATDSIVAAVGTNAFSFTGLVINTTYYIHYVQEDTVGPTFSNVVSTIAFSNDDVPDQFNLGGDATNQANGATNVESSVDTLAGTTIDTAISITGGEYRIDAGAYTAIAGTISPGQTIQVRGDAGATRNTTVAVVLTIGGVSDTFNISTVFITLSNPLDAAAGSSTADIQVDTNVGTPGQIDGGSIFWVVTQSATTPTHAQIVAGLDDLGAAADASGSDPAASPTTLDAVTGLVATTNYWTHFAQEDDDTIAEVAPVSADGFITASTAPTFTSGPLASNINDTQGQIDATAVDDSGTLDHYASVYLQSDSPTNADIKLGTNAAWWVPARLAVTTGDPQTWQATGLEPGTAYRVQYLIDNSVVEVVGTEDFVTSAAGPNITQVNFGNNPRNNQNSVLVDGTGFGAVEGTIFYNTQSLVVLAWSDIQVEVVWPDIPENPSFDRTRLVQAHDVLLITADEPPLNSTSPVTTEPADGFVFRAIAELVPSNSIFTDDDFITNDEMYGEFIVGDGSGVIFEVDPLLRFTGVINAIPNGAQFRYRIFDIDLSLWSNATEVGDPDGLQPETFNSSALAAFNNVNGNGIIVDQSLTNLINGLRLQGIALGTDAGNFLTDSEGTTLGILNVLEVAAAIQYSFDAGDFVVNDMRSGPSTLEVTGTGTEYPLSVITSLVPQAGWNFVDIINVDNADPQFGTGGSTNLCLQSQTLEVSPWGVQNGISIGVNVAIAPDSSLTAEQLNRVTGPDDGIIQDITLSLATRYTLSAHYQNVDSAESDLFIIDSAFQNVAELEIIWTGGVPSTGGSANALNITYNALGGGWFRISYDFLSDAVLTGHTIVSRPSASAGANGESIYAWGFQLELGNQLTAYTPTTSSPVTGSGIAIDDQIQYEIQATALPFDVVVDANGVVSIDSFGDLTAVTFDFFIYDVGTNAYLAQDTYNYQELAPALTTPVLDSNGEVTATSSMTTDKFGQTPGQATGGTAYAMAVLSGATPSHADIVAGTGAEGTPVSVAVTAAVVQFPQITGLTASTAYEIYMTQEDGNGNPALAVVTTGAFSTDAPTVGVPVFAGAIANQASFESSDPIAPRDFSGEWTGTVDLYTLIGEPLPDGLVLGSGNGIVSGSPTSGVFEFINIQIRADNSSGQGGVSNLFNWNIVSSEPQFEGNIADQAGAEADAVNLNVTIEWDEDPANTGESPSYSIVSGTLPPGLSLASVGLITGTPTTGEGTFPNIIVRATNSFGFTDSNPFEWTITSSNPVFIGPAVGDQVGQEAVAISALDASTLFTSVATQTFSLTGAPPGIVIDSGTGIISGTPTQEGTFDPVQVISTNIHVGIEAATGSNSFQWVVAGAAQAPAWQTIPLQSDPLGVPLSFDFGPFVTLGDTFAIIIAPTGLTIVDDMVPVISGTPEDVANFAARFSATNPQGTTQSATFEWDITGPLAPVFDGAIGNQRTVVDSTTERDFTDQWTRDPNDPGTWSITAGVLPSNLTLNVNTGIISGSPDTIETQVGIELTNTNSVGADASNTFQWEITAVVAATGEPSENVVSISIGLSL